MREALERRAEKERRTVSDVVVLLLGDALKTKVRGRR